jgi:hypothetical protein
MKTRFLFLAMLAFSFAFISCVEDDNDDNDLPDLKDDYFRIYNGTYNSGSMPAAGDGPTISDLSGNGTVLAGGSNNISISSTGDASNVLVSVQGADGYYSVPMYAKSDYYITISFTQDISGDFTIRFALQDANGRVGLYETLAVSTLQAGTGKFQVNLSWNQPNDMDLHLIEPGGEEIYFGNTEAASGGELDVDSNPGCSIDNINSENITYGDDAVVPAGVYEVIVDRWDNCYVTDPTRFTVTATLNGSLIQGDNPLTRSWAADYTDDEEVTVMTVSINQELLKNAQKAYKFDFGRFTKKKVLSPDKVK